ncbi:MAG: transposase, partial [Anaerolineae bacterium]
MKYSSRLIASIIIRFHGCVNGCCRAAGVPDEIEFATKPALGKAMLGRRFGSGTAGPAGHKRRKGEKRGNSRNGHRKRTIQTTAGQAEIEVPRDRAGAY